MSSHANSLFDLEIFSIRNPKQSQRVWSRPETLRDFSAEGAGSQVWGTAVVAQPLFAVLNTESRSYERTSDRNSSRVCLLSRNTPSIALVEAIEFCFSTPRITMHRWRASMITPTP